MTSPKTTGSAKIAVFCSASELANPVFMDDTRELARGLSERKWELLYGGGRAGLMGHFADRALESGVVVRGATTEGLAGSREGLHPGLTESLIVKDLFARKRWFLDEADAFLIFPGGYGTLDEALEVITWKALDYHDKPIVFVNSGGFWQHLLQTFEEFARQGAIRPGGLELYRVSPTLADAWKVLDAHIALRL
jgi:uncharacterized protein (TIGR00730 family)